MRYPTIQRKIEAYKMATSTEERPWILSTVPKFNIIFGPMQELERRYRVIHWDDFRQEEDKYAPTIEALFVTLPGFPRMSDKLLTKMTKLKGLVTVTMGTDHLDLPLLRKYNLRVFSGQDVCKDSCADFALCLMLSAARRIPEMTTAARHCPDGSNLPRTRHLLGREVSGATLGIVGMGRIGFEVARRAQGFRMKILYHSRNQRKDEDEVNATYCVTLEDLLPHVDFLVLTAPLTDDTRRMLRKQRFQMMKSTAIVINIARGKLIDHDDLVEALRCGTIGGAALDVTDPEPLPEDHPLLHMSNVIITPHASTDTVEGLTAMYQRGVDNLGCIFVNQS